MSKPACKDYIGNIIFREELAAVTSPKILKLLKKEEITVANFGALVKK